MRHGQYRFIVGFLVLPLALYAIFVISPFKRSIAAFGVPVGAMMPSQMVAS